MGRCVLGGVGRRGVVVTVVLLQLVLCHHVVAVGCRQRDAAEVQHGPAAGGAVCRRAVVGQSHGEVGAAGDGHVVDLLLGGRGSDVKLCVQTWPLLLLGPCGHAHHSSRAHVWFDENVVDYRRHAEDRGEVWQGLGGGCGNGAGHLQPGLRLDLLRRQGLGVRSVQACAEVSGAGKDDVDVEAVRRSRFVLCKVLVDHGGALSSVFLVTGVG